MIDRAERQALIDDLDAPTAVIDASGVVQLVNRAWRRFGADNGAPDCDETGGSTISGPAPDSCGLGVSYSEWLEDPNDELARRAAHAVFDVIEGRVETADVVYPCHAPDEERWFRLLVTSLDEQAPRSALAVHVRLDTMHGAREFGVDAPPVHPERTVCAWCGARELGAHGAWTVLAGPIGDDVAVSHGICPSCADEQLAGLGGVSQDA